MIVIDIDQFKTINDRFGHGTGDHTLTALGKLLRDQMTDQHLVARTGGEEFCIVLPDTSSSAATALAESIREACENIGVSTINGQPVPVTISAGVCDVPDGVSFDGALIRADNALYIGKREGRNRVQVCAESALAQ